MTNAGPQREKQDQRCLVEARNLKKHYPVRDDAGGASVTKAVDDVSFKIPAGSIMGLVGESGCGKTTVGRILVNLLKPTGGEVLFDGIAVTNRDKSKAREIRRRMQIVFQDPYSSLDPRMNVYEIIGEGIKNYKLTRDRAELRERVEYLAERCGLFASQCRQYPHQFSGGQRQRICIARALATNPDFVVCDEAVSALDVSIQAQIINLLKELQEDMGLTYLFISHDLRVVEFLSDRVAVMYLGQIVEEGSTEDVYGQCLHPYTEALLSASPAFTKEEKAAKKRIILDGEISSVQPASSGCVFLARCPRSLPECGEMRPRYREISPGHFAACHRTG
jgi:peptide/nickel transport system ATP-binding protein/oligopeptide transport system ATP-binding protein